MTDSHEIVGDAEWLAARKALLTKEKELTRLRDEMSAMRRALPWRRLGERYVFEGPEGERTLASLFDGRGQLLVYHFMFGPTAEAGCPSCSFWADQFDAMIPHLRARDTAFAVISRAPLPKLRAYAERMGWRFTWVSSAANDFNADFGVTLPSEREGEGDAGTLRYNFGTQPGRGELPGASVFVADGDEIFHSYSTYSRGLDMLNGAYHWLDLTPKGRDEAGLSWSMAWVRRHDEYPR